MAWRTRQGSSGQTEWFDDGTVENGGILSNNLSYSYIGSVPTVTLNTTPDIQNTYVGPPEMTNLTQVINDLTNRGVPDVTINGYKISGLMQNYAVLCVDALRKGTVTHIQKLEKDNQILKEKLMLTGETKDPTTGRRFREDDQ